MKKIKYLLLGIVSLLGIGYSFSYNTAFLSYTNSSGTNHYYTNLISSALHWGFINSDGVKFSPYGQTFGCQVNVNQSMYFENYYSDKAIFFPEQYCSYTKIGNPTINNSSAVSRYYINSGVDSLLFNYLHVFYLTDRNYYDDYFFLTSSYLYNMSGEYLDIPGGLSRVKVIPGLYKSYSSISVSNGLSEDYSDDYFQFSFVPEDGFQDGGFYNITGILVLHNDYYSNGFLTGTNTIILFKDNSNIYYNLFDDYSNSLVELLSLTPSSKGILYFNGSNGFSSFSDFVFDSGSLIQSSFGNGYLTFNSVNKNLEYGNMSFSVQFSLNSDDSVISWFDFINGGVTQSTGSIAINTGFLDLCLNNLEFGDLNSYLCNQLLNGNNLVQIPNQTGYYLSYGVDSDGRIRFWITYQEDLEQQMSGYIWEQDENGNRYTYLPEVINTGIESTSGLTDYFHNWFERGIFFSCPFHYTDSYYREFKLFGVMHYVPKLGDTFLYPIYCIGAGFKEGKNIDFFSGVNLGLESQLLSSPDYNYLYRLFDLILSVLIMFFIIKIYHLLN